MMTFRALTIGCLSLLLLSGCESSGGKRDDGANAAQRPSDTTNSERADAAAAEDADRYRAEPRTTSAPSQRPPAPRTRRPVDQPRAQPRR